MQISANRISAATTAVMALLFVTAQSAPAQWLDYPTPGIPRTPDGEPDLFAPTPRTPDGKPDMSGVWMVPSGITQNIADLVKDGKEVPFQPWAEELFNERRANNSRDDPNIHCLPSGITMKNVLATPWKFVQTPELTLILYESRNMYRQIFVDGRPLPAVVGLPTWYGYSIGRWEEDTLVIESAGFNGWAWHDQAGHPATEDLHLTERFYRRDFGHLEMEITIDDPEAYTEPWTIVHELNLLPDTDLLEYVCNENEKDAQHILGQ